MEQNQRAAYVEALQNERAMVASRPEPNKTRIRAIDDQLAQYADEPSADGPVETAVPGPISSARAKAAKKTAAAKQAAAAE